MNFKVLNKKMLNILVLIILIGIPLYANYYLRMQSDNLPVMEDYAYNQVVNFYSQQITSEVQKKFAYLPVEEQNKLIQEQLNQFMSSNWDKISKQIENSANAFKDKYKDNNGDTYLLAIDPYLQYQYTKNYVNTGTYGDKIIDGEPVMTLRGGRFNHHDSFRMHPFIMSKWYYILNFFDSSISIMKAVFLFPVFLMSFAVLFAFLIGKRLTNNFGGFVFSSLIATHSSLIARTAAGFSDTDVYNVFYPLLIIWLFLESYYAKDKIKTLIYSSLSGLSLALYSITWAGFWFMHTSLFLITMGYFTIYLTKIYTLKLRNEKVSKLINSKFKHSINLLFGYIGGSFIFMFLLDKLVMGYSIVNSFLNYFNMLLYPLNFIKFKEVAISSIWPNVLTTVAELNSSNISKVITVMGGKIIFFLALIGLTLSYLSNKKLKELNKSEKLFISFTGFWYLIIMGFLDSFSSVFMFLFTLVLPLIIAYILKLYYIDFDLELFVPMIVTTLFVATFYGSVRGLRFSALNILFVSMSLAIAVYYLYNLLLEGAKGINLSSTYAKPIIIILLLLTIFYVPNLLSHSLTQARNEVPSFNDAWYNTLHIINKTSSQAIITSWWDFGHWFYSISQRQVTFDGGDQGKRIHWVGKTLLTNDEKESVDILRMLNCGQNKAYETLFKTTNDSYKSIILINKILPLTKTEAKKLLEENNLDKEIIDSVISYTFCDDLIDQYYIASSDMVGKSGVWAHFGIWDFDKAYQFNIIQNNNQKIAVEKLISVFNFSEENAINLYKNAKGKNGDHWVAPWPSYDGRIQECKQSKTDYFVCGNGLIINLTSQEIYGMTQQGIKHPKTFSYLYNGTVKTKHYSTDLIDGDIGSIFYSKEGRWFIVLGDYRLVDSIFTKMYFFEGKGLKYFKKINKNIGPDGSEIILYALDWNSTKEWWDK